jgi:hypothetical protein
MLVEDSLSTDPQAAIIAGIDAEIRHEQNRPLGAAKRPLKKLLEKPALAHVTDLRNVRSVGLDTWISQGAAPGLIGVLFPNDPEARRKARQAKLRRTLARVRSRAPAATQNAARFGPVWKGSVALDSMMREHFAGMTVARRVTMSSAGHVGLPSGDPGCHHLTTTPWRTGCPDALAGHSTVARKH